ncbi:hypothetical protein M422DRAFT_276082 [Sphaerobolus stellatus SS14]|uniref:Uncharacterized protein n=1 Tax=Sphaerobolus stellatus (strain SS14) TaxID=990650 RepID=A0A0C9T3A1_SPHS4|nr:hypothetical protein M422DRAFT_276082 [Sphaerobolus stellatus SS14]
MAAFFQKQPTSSNFSTPSHPPPSGHFQHLFPSQYHSHIPQHSNGHSPYHYVQQGSPDGFVWDGPSRQVDSTGSYSFKHPNQEHQSQKPADPQRTVDQRDLELNARPSYAELEKEVEAHKIKAYGKLLEHVGPASEGSTIQQLGTPNASVLTPEPAPIRGILMVDTHDGMEPCKQELYLCHEDGASLSKLEASKIRATARSLWQSLLFAGVAPPYWGDADAECLKYFRHGMYNMHPLLALCDGHWKVNTLATHNYPSFIRDYLVDVESGDEEEEGDNEETQATASKKRVRSLSRIGNVPSKKHKTNDLKTTTKLKSKLKTTKTASRSSADKTATAKPTPPSAKPITSLAEPTPSSTELTPSSAELDSLSTAQPSSSSTSNASSGLVSAQAQHIIAGSQPHLPVQPSIPTAAILLQGPSPPPSSSPCLQYVTPLAPKLPQPSPSTATISKEPTASTTISQDAATSLNESSDTAIESVPSKEILSAQTVLTSVTDGMTQGDPNARDNTNTGVRGMEAKKLVQRVSKRNTPTNLDPFVNVNRHRPIPAIPHNTTTDNAVLSSHINKGSALPGTSRESSSSSPKVTAATPEIDISPPFKFNSTVFSVRQLLALDLQANQTTAVTKATVEAAMQSMSKEEKRAFEKRGAEMRNAKKGGK